MLIRMASPSVPLPALSSAGPACATSKRLKLLETRTCLRAPFRYFVSKNRGAALLRDRPRVGDR
jgi:hypothetical protein